MYFPSSGLQTSPKHSGDRVYSIGVVHTVVETPGFLADTRGLGLTGRALVDGSLDRRQSYGGGGDGRNRWRTEGTFCGEGSGQSGGYRVITFYSGIDVPVFLLNVFAKNERANLTPKECATLNAILAATVRAYRNRKELR